MAARGLGRLMVAAIFVVLAMAASPAHAKPPPKKCPENTSKEFFANPVVDRVKGLKPTGVEKPAECSFPTLSAALKKANGEEGTVIAKGYKPGKSAVFDKEPAFPLIIGNRTRLTTYEDPDPNRSSEKAIRQKHYAVSNLTDSPTLELGEESVVHDFTLLNDSKEPADASVVCDEPGVDLADLQLDGKGKKGSKTVTGIEMESECSGRFTDIEIDGFSGDGIVIGGAASLEDVTVVGSGGDGVVVNTAQPVSITNPLFRHNKNYGLMVERTGAASLTVSGDRPTLRSLGEIAGNGADGIHIGKATPAGDIHASFSGLDIYDNEIGIQVEDQGARAYEVILLDNDVYTNSENGMLIGPSHIGQAIDDPEPAIPDTPTFAQNKIHNNGLNQLVFDGGGRDFTFEIDSPTHQCDAGANAVYDYTSKNVFGVFAQGNADVFVRHTQFEGGGTGLKDFSAQSGSTINVDENCAAIPGP